MGTVVSMARFGGGRRAAGRGTAGAGPLRRGTAGPAPIDWSAQDWEDLVPRLLLLAAGRLSRMVWRGRRDGVRPAEAEDFVADAIAKTIAGVRQWNPQACTLFQHLAGVVVSDVSHAATAMDNRTTVSPAADPDGTAGAPVTHADSAPDQEEIAAWRSQCRHLLGHLDTIDPPLGRLAAAMLIDDLRETADLCRVLDLPAADIANLRKRLKRAVRGYLQEAAP
ncbi:MAG: hypothetical protein HKM95_03840 [Inquilinus sp.]|nr:hypothetical protein [Inquilinus sp.]